MPPGPPPPRARSPGYPAAYQQSRMQPAQSPRYRYEPGPGSDRGDPVWDRERGRRAEVHSSHHRPRAPSRERMGNGRPEMPSRSSTLMSQSGGGAPFASYSRHASPPLPPPVQPHQYAAYKRSPALPAMRDSPHSTHTRSPDQARRRPSDESPRNGSQYWDPRRENGAPPQLRSMERERERERERNAYRSPRQSPVEPLPQRPQQQQAPSRRYDPRLDEPQPSRNSNRMYDQPPPPPPPAQMQYMYERGERPSSPRTGEKRRRMEDSPVDAPPQRRADTNSVVSSVSSGSRRQRRSVGPPGVNGNGNGVQQTPQPKKEPLDVSPRLGDLMDKKVQQKRTEYARKVRVTKREVDAELQKPRGQGYGYTSWKPGRELSFAQRRDINQARLRGGFPTIQFASRPDGESSPLTGEDERTTVEAFLVAYKEENVEKQDWYKCPQLFNMHVKQRNKILAAEDQKRLDLYRPTMSAGRDAARPDIGRAMRANQHLRRFFRVFRDEGIIVISNVPYVPDLPPLPHSKRLRRDGRYGYHEDTIFPQMHHPGHWCMAFCPSFAGHHCDLKSDMAWYKPTFNSFHFAVEPNGRYRAQDNLKEAIRKLCERESEKYEQHLTAVLGSPQRAADDMFSSAGFICNSTMTQNEFLTHFGILQRSVLELRAWKAYEQALAVQKRLARRMGQFENWIRPADVSTINRDYRGVFVTDYDTANIYGHLQVPVWWIRGMSNKLLRLLKEKGFVEVFNARELGLPVPVLDLMPAMDGNAAGQIYDADSDDDDGHDIETQTPRSQRQDAEAARKTTGERQVSAPPRDDDDGSQDIVMHGDDGDVVMHDDPPMREQSVVPPPLREPTVPLREQSTAPPLRGPSVVPPPLREPTVVFRGKPALDARVAAPSIVVFNAETRILDSSAATTSVHSATGEGSAQFWNRHVDYEETSSYM
ncbi:hypothetical protein AURDEDRAFT_177728 [Auricularia subglabra TFB-10046 SS5]|uniref:Uncharacterized protein n=1 Tax=Auricularia subglabra (strain TFB-10046 / SS5) TaxID=717982 RepID=J0WLJ2_AURST|nr:hypothetical protein AURDEDRAFT_177728 [Auricularia subglabra TFB-10046 SS5]